MPQIVAQEIPLAGRANWRQLRCSFCGKDADHVRFLAAGAAGAAGGMICDRCNLTSLGIFLKARIASALGMARG